MECKVLLALLLENLQARGRRIEKLAILPPVTGKPCKHKNDDKCRKTKVLQRVPLFQRVSTCFIVFQRVQPTMTRSKLRKPSQGALNPEAWQRRPHLRLSHLRLPYLRLSYLRLSWRAKIRTLKLYPYYEILLLYNSMSTCMYIYLYLSLCLPSIFKIWVRS